ncbi:MAG TPA: hypothetical protein VFW19_08545 [Allosphingosinicella sp.]|nr:hypothetical protein [Allosphingosinicella sp.]
MTDELGVALHCQQLGHFPMAWQGKSGFAHGIEVEKARISALPATWHGPCMERGIPPRGGEAREEEMVVMSRIGQSVVASIAAVMLAAATVGAAVGPVGPEARPGTAVPAALVVALLSSQAGA